MIAVVRPTSEEELAEAIAASEDPFEIVGTGTKRQLGRPMAALPRIDMSGFDQIHLYEPEELVIEVGAGMTLATISALLAERGQQLAFEPPDFSSLLGGDHAGTIGGLASCNLSGPRRLKAGAARDHILGVRGVSGRGEAFKAGGRVVKNVTGYDLAKLMCGAHGTLAALTTVTFKVIPVAEHEETLVLLGLDVAGAVAAMARAMASPADVSGAAHLPGRGTFLRLDGIAPSVAYRREALIRLLAGGAEVLGPEESWNLWQEIRDVRPLASSPSAIWRLLVAPTSAPTLIKRLEPLGDIAFVLDWAGGLIWLAVPASGDAGAGSIRSALGEGHATLVRAPEAIRAEVEVFQPQPPALASLTRRVKDSFDPARRLNPGRMFRGL